MTGQRRAFGERLRRARERRQISLESIAGTTKIAVSLFAGLEKGDCSKWPGGVYNRAFVRSYAAAIGLDPDETAAEFADYYPEAPAAEPNAAAAPASPLIGAPATGLRLQMEPDPTERNRRIARLAAIVVIDILVVVVIAAAAVFATRAPFWISVAITSLVYHVITRIAGTVLGGDRLRVPPADVAAGAESDEVPVRGTASTIA